VGATKRAHADCHEAAVGYGERRWPEWRLYEVLRLYGFWDPVGAAPIDRFRIIWTGGLTLSGPQAKASKAEVICQIFEGADSLQAFHQLWHGGEQIGLQAVVGHREDRGFRVLVDRHDHLAVLHAGQVLDSP
jgi:hypothetical protein